MVMPGEHLYMLNAIDEPCALNNHLVTWMKLMPCRLENLLIPFGGSRQVTGGHRTATGIIQAHDR